MNFYERIHLRNQNYNQTMEHFYHLKRFPYILPPPWLWAIVALPPVAIGYVIFSKVFYRWPYMLRIFLNLASFI